MNQFGDVYKKHERLDVELSLTTVEWNESI